MDLPNRSDLFAVGRRYIKTVGNTRINPLMVDVPGSDINLIVGSGSLQGEAIVTSWAACVRGLLVDTARGDELDRIAFDRFGLTRKPANPAGVTLALTRPTFAAGGGTIGAGTRVTTVAGTIFATVIDVVFGATDLAKSVDAVAQVVGPDQNVPTAAITSFVDQPFDATITVTNQAPAAGGTDQESDAQFRGRIRGFFLTVRRGTIAAIQYGGLQVPGVAVATAFEIVNPGTALPAGAGELIVADAAGNASAGMVQAVKDEMLAWRPIGIPIFVSGGIVQFEAITYRLSFEPGVDTVAASEEVRAVAVAVAQFLNPGQTLLRAQLTQVPLAVPGVVISDSGLVAPIGDIIPDDNTHMIRVRPQDVSFV